MICEDFWADHKFLMYCQIFTKVSALVLLMRNLVPWKSCRRNSIDFVVRCVSGVCYSGHDQMSSLVQFIFLVHGFAAYWNIYFFGSFSAGDDWCFLYLFLFFSSSRVTFVMVFDVPVTFSVPCNFLCTCSIL